MSQKITKKAMKAWIKHKLCTDKVWAERALFRIYDRQTQDEQAIKDTAINNGVGFTGLDGNLLTDMVQNMLVKRKKISNYRFSNKQFDAIIFPKMQKYWQQIIDVSDVDKLEAAYWNDPMNIQTELKLEV